MTGTHEEGDWAKLLDHSLGLLAEKDAGTPGSERYLVDPGSVLRSALLFTVWFRDGPEPAVAFLREKGADALLVRCAQAAAVARTHFLADRTRKFPPSEDCPKALLHAAWLLGDFDSAEVLLCPLPGGEEPTPKMFGPKVVAFWHEYHLALSALAAGARGARAFAWPSPKGPERYWAQFLPLVNAALDGSDAAPAIAAIESEFERQNGDKRPAFGPFEGWANQPARWDLRLASLRRAAAHYLDRQL